MTRYIEHFVPVVQYHGLNTQKAVSLESTLAVTGATTLTGAVTANGGITVGGASTFTSGTGAVTLSGPVTQKANVISGSGATVTLTAAQSGSTVLFDRAAGIIYTLPAPVVGLWFEFVITVSITSNNAKIITDAGTTLLIGQVYNAVAAGTGTTFIANGSTHIACTQNGTTTGGLIGTSLLVSCVSATLWEVTGTVLGSGTIATPFATS